MLYVKDVKSGDNMLIVWLAMAGILAVAEMLTLTAAIGPFAFSSLVAAGLVAIGAPMWSQIAAFAVVGIFSVLLLRPVVRRHQAKPTLTGPQAMVGEEIELTEDVGPGDQGRIKAHGSLWAARSPQLVPAGTRVRIIKVDGATIEIQPMEES